MDPSIFLPLASTVRAPTQTRRTTTTGQGLGETLENVITLGPVGNKMVDSLQALEGGDGGGSCYEQPDERALTMAPGDRSISFLRAPRGERRGANGLQNRVAQGELLGRDAEKPGDDGGHAETSGRPSVQSLEEELADEASTQPEFDFLRRGILWHILHGWGDLCAHRGLLVRALQVGSNGIGVRRNFTVLTQKIS